MNNVTVEFYKKGNVVGSQTGSPDCSKPVNIDQMDRGAFFSTSAWMRNNIKKIDEIRVSIDGADAFYIDHLVFAYKLSGCALGQCGWEKKSWWGRNKGKGWCLSTDKNDHKKAGWEKYVDEKVGCSSCFRFVRSGTKVYTCSK